MADKKKSAFTAKAAFADGDTLDFVRGANNYKITYENSVKPNDTHRDGDGSDHSDVAANTVARHDAATVAGSPLSIDGQEVTFNYDTDYFSVDSNGDLYALDNFIRVVSIQVTDPNGTVVATGDGKAYFRVPSIMNGYNLIDVAAHVTTVSSSGLPTVQIYNVTEIADMLSTKITIDENEKDSKDAATPAVIDDAEDYVATGDELRIDVDTAGTGTKGLIVEMQFQKA